MQETRTPNTRQGNPTQIATVAKSRDTHTTACKRHMTLQLYVDQQIHVFDGIAFLVAKHGFYSEPLVTQCAFAVRYHHQ